MPKATHDDVSAPGPKPTIRERIGKVIAGDALTTESNTGSALGYPWSYAEPYKRPIGSLFKTTAEISNDDRNDFWERYPFARRAIELPIDEAIDDQLEIHIDGKKSERAMVLWEKHKESWMQHFKLTRTYGHCAMAYGWQDSMERWQTKGTLKQGTKYSWVRPIAISYESRLEETDSFPNYLKSITVNYGVTNIQMAPDRITFSLLPKLSAVSMTGESVINILYNLLHIQIHSDWSIGQSLFRRASGLLALFAPKRNVSVEEKSEALSSIANHNSKTTLYMPFGWNVKDVLKPGGNMAIARTYNLITQQMAVATGIPESILTAKNTPSDADSGDRKMFYSLVTRQRKNLITPTLKNWLRKTQVAGMLESGKIEIKYSDLNHMTELEKEEELTRIGAMRLLQARIDMTTDGAGNITDANAEGSPNNTELVKIITAKK